MPAGEAQSGPTRLGFAKVFVLPVVWLFLLPTVGVVFTHYGEAKLDAQFREWVEREVAQSKAPEADKARALEFFRKNPPSRICRFSAAERARLHAEPCNLGDDSWQFIAAERVSWAALGLGLAAVLGALVLGLVAFANRNAQYWSFMLGWRALTLISAIEIVLQGALAVWLSYWVSALLFEVYVVKLILLVAVLAASAMWIALRAIFRAPPEPEPLEAEGITEADAPGLWSRVRELARGLGTEPPGEIVAGIDDNFFVTEAGLTLAAGKLSGRALYVSLPLLRVLEPSEASAVFAHELAHFRGGDTADSARLGPKLVRYDLYMQALGAGGVTRPAFFLMRMYRAIFELASSRERRHRELLADQAAAEATSPDDLGRSLLKITAYSSFREETERSLFRQLRQHEGELAIRDRIDAGLGAYVLSAQFTHALRSTRTPHPFDSHPLLEERLANVRAKVAVEQASSLLQERPAHSWADEVDTAGAIEQRLWGAYEARFRQNHEISLAFRYLPANEEERRHVERFFPPKEFALPRDRTLRVTYRGLELPGFELGVLEFDRIVGAKVQSGTFSNVLVISYERAGEKPGKVKVNLKDLKKQAGAFQATFSNYWTRAQSARQFALQTRSSPSTAASA
jgi:Zn-dependent protease with chaperone function